MDNRKVWHILPGRHWPQSLQGEREFINKIREKYSAEPYDRDDLSILLTMLRCGTTIESILKIAPGFTPGSLISAYEDMERKRVTSILAWMEIEKKPTLDNFMKNKEEAAKLLPVVIGNIANNEELGSKSSLARIIKEVAAMINNMRIVATGKETLLYKHSYPNSKCIELGSELFNPSIPGIYGNSYYLPDRVSSLSPLRVRDLLVESLIDEYQ